jgi:hypothetical protein
MVLVLSLLLATAAFSQSPYRDQAQPATRESFTQPVMNSGIAGLIDPSRITMSHQMGMSYSSAGGNGMTQGYYMNTIQYRFNAPVLLRLRLGATNNPWAQNSAGPGQGGLAGMLQDAEFFGGADLVWKPKDNIHLQLSVDRLPPGLYSMPGRYGMASFMRSSLSPYGSYGQMFGSSMGWENE